MLFILIPISIAAVSLALAGRVVYRKMPHDKAEWDSAISDQEFGPTFYEKGLAIASQKSKETLLAVSTKLVYKLKITSLKSDNFLSQVLQQIKHHKENNQIISVQTSEPVAVEEHQLATIIQPAANKKVDFISSPIAVVDEAEIVPNQPAKIEEEKLSHFAFREQQYINQLAYNPKDVSIYKKLGWLYLENNQPIQARQSFKMAVKLGSKDKIVMTKLLEMGGVLHKEGSGVYNPSVALHKTSEKPVVSKTVMITHSHHSHGATHGTAKKAKPAKPKKIKVTKV